MVRPLASAARAAARSLVAGVLTMARHDCRSGAAASPRSTLARRASGNNSWAIDLGAADVACGHRASRYLGTGSCAGSRPPLHWRVTRQDARGAAPTRLITCGNDSNGSGAAVRTSPERQQRTQCSTPNDSNLSNAAVRTNPATAATGQRCCRNGAPRRALAGERLNGLQAPQRRARVDRLDIGAQRGYQRRRLLVTNFGLTASLCV